MFPDADYAGRIARARALMAEGGVGALLLSTGSDLPYFTGYQASPYERLTMLVVTPVAAALVVPRLEAPRVADRGAFEIVPWGETDDPVAITIRLAGSPPAAAIGDHTWSRFLLALQEGMPGTAFQPATPLTSVLRVCKDGDEIGWLGRAGAAADRVVERLAGERFSGRTEREMASLIGTMLVEEGHETVSFVAVASGPNGASPHHEPSDRVMGPGDAVVVDFGGRMKGYHSDTTRMFCIGEPSPGFADALAVLREAQEAAVAAVAPGVPAEEVDRAARSVISAAGHGEHFIHRTGHGIGLEVHEDPYLVEGSERLLEVGMAFSVEPGIYVPGEWGMRIEDIVVVADGGAERLNRSDRGPYVVD